uniref:Uncharacterized protein n=1 Tax=Acrobeloides nanus TaxID=290746 RepID=A0A914DSP9_9BILA
MQILLLPVQTIELPDISPLKWFKKFIFRTKITRSTTDIPDNSYDSYENNGPGTVSIEIISVKVCHKDSDCSKGKICYYGGCY